jgi:hypothetical protein
MENACQYIRLRKLRPIISADIHAKWWVEPNDITLPISACLLWCVLAVVPNELLHTIGLQLQQIIGYNVRNGANLNLDYYNIGC